MTTRKLTPAEALECLTGRFLFSNDATAHHALAVLEEALASQPTAPVPSDEEIVNAIKRSETWGDKTSYSALRLLARRIGVQGVPQ